MVLSIRLLGTPAVFGDDGVERPVRGRQAWAVLARVLLADRPVWRRQIAAELFPDAVDPLGSVRWCLASLRRALGPAALNGDPISADLPPGTRVDLWDAENGDWDATDAGQLLEGSEPKASNEFGTWLLIEREQFASLVESRLRHETMVAISFGDLSRAIRLAEITVRRRPFDEGAHVLLVRSLALDGRTAAAVEHIEATEKAFLAELGERPSPALRSAARRSTASAPEGVTPRATIESLIEAGTAALSAGAADAGVDCLRRATEAAESAGDKHLLSRTHLELGSALVHAVRGYDDEGAIHLRQAADLARACGSASLAATSLRELGYVDALAGRRPAAAKLLDEALAAGDDDPGGLAGIFGTIAFNLVDWGRCDEGFAQFETSLDHARRGGSRRREIWSLGLGGWGLLAAGKPEAALDWLQRCLALCDDVHWLSFRPWPLSGLAEAHLRLAEEPASLRGGVEDAIALSRQIGDPCWEAATARVMALTFAASRDYDSAGRWLVTARERCTAMTDPFAGLLVTILSDQVRLSAAAGEEETSRTLARDLIALAARTHADAHLNAAMALLGSGGPRPAATG